jgi:hypothetical protein
MVCSSHLEFSPLRSSTWDDATTILAQGARATCDVPAQEQRRQEAFEGVDRGRAFQMRIDLRRLFEHAHRLGMRGDAKRREVPRIAVGVANFGASGNLPILLLFAISSRVAT